MFRRSENPTYRLKPAREWLSVLEPARFVQRLTRLVRCLFSLLTGRLEVVSCEPSDSRVYPRVEHSYRNLFRTSRSAGCSQGRAPPVFFR
jgi:hypothetical protein